MGGLLTVLAVLFIGVSFVCSIIVLVAAFKDEVWKGILYLVCGLYGLYYALFEYDADNKPLVLVGMFGGSIIGYALLFGAGAVSGVHPTSP